MSLIRKLKSNYLSHPHNQYGLFCSLGFIALCFILSSLYWSEIGELQNILPATPHTVFSQKDWWQPWTTALIHSDLAHLLSNSIMLAVMGYFVSSYYGLWPHPVLSFVIGGGVCNLIVLTTMTEKVTLLGSSGIVFYLWGLWQILYIFIQRHISLNLRFMKIVAVNLFLLVPQYFDPHVSYFAHGVGFLLGVVSGAVIFFLKKEAYQSYEIYKLKDVADDDELLPSERYWEMEIDDGKNEGKGKDNDGSEGEKH